MSSLTNFSSNIPNEGTFVLKLLNGYMAAYIEDDQKIGFISKHPDAEIKVAALAALRFSSENDIPFCQHIVELELPIIGIVVENREWYPAEFYLNSIWFDRHHGSLESVAKEKAEQLADTLHRTFIPTLQINL